MPEDAERGPPGRPADLPGRIRAYWERTGVPGLARAGPADGPSFRFTEGPPTANGSPHVGHIVGRALKDAELRFWRMRGRRIVTPMAGWDCHGLPVELEIEKRHGLKSKKEIESFGVERFCNECRSSALETIALWREMSERMGYWLDYEGAYRTMDAPYIESVWWSLRQLFDRHLLEKGHYVLPYCPRCETPLSSHEVAQGYREATDPSVVVRFRLVPRAGEPPTDLLVWTTTPWTLPSNLLIAARRDLAYVRVAGEGGAEAILAEVAVARELPSGPRVLGRLTGADLEGREYVPLFPHAGPGPNRYRVVLDDSVEAKEGTGFVHTAPAFGPEDQRIGAREGVGNFDPLDSRGVFTDQVPEVAGKPFKAADRVLLAALRERGALARESTVRHTYPFCWRCATPLIYRAVDSWFVRTSRFSPELIANNRAVTWVPAHLREGRFGNFLTEAKDWAVSRSRYWGTPLPIWICPDGHATCVGSFAELAQRMGSPLPADFDPHRVTVDAMRFPCPTCAAAGRTAEARREPYTIDAWYDSGSAPFAQYHYPFEPGPFDPAAPLDYIAEGLDQTRGWFYTLLVLSTALFHRPAYRVCIANGLALDATGQKMSKSKGNVLEPLALLAAHGGDAVRFWFLSVDYTEPMSVSEPAIRQAGQRTLGTLLNVLEFFRANAPPGSADDLERPPEATTRLDAWILSRLHGTVRAVTAGLESYDPRAGAIALRELVDDLSSWYLRRSRPRFWEEEATDDRRAAGRTLGYVLGVVARLLAPYAPFTAEALWADLRGDPLDRAPTSVHLARWPEAAGAADPALEAAMAGLRALVETGRELRQRAGVKSRMPLAMVVLAPAAARTFLGLGPEGDRLLAEELNVKAVLRVARIGPEQYPPARWVTREEDATTVVALPREPDPELIAEGLVREVLRRLQRARKELGLDFSDHVRLTLFADAEIFAALEPARATLVRELLADHLELDRGPAPPGRGLTPYDVDGRSFAARLERVPRAA